MVQGGVVRGVSEISPGAIGGIPGATGAPDSTDCSAARHIQTDQCRPHRWLRESPLPRGTNHHLHFLFELQELASHLGDWHGMNRLAIEGLEKERRWRDGS